MSQRRVISQGENLLGETVTAYQVGRRIVSVVLLDGGRASVSLFSENKAGHRIPIVQDLDGNIAEMFYDQSQLDALFTRLEKLDPPPDWPVPMVGTAAEFSELLHIPVTET